MASDTIRLVGNNRLEFSYSQFLIFDSDELQPGCDWQQGHVGQGFARRNSVACFSTLLEFGTAVITACCEQYEHDAVYERVISVPFFTQSGTIRVEGPDEHPVERIIHVGQGHYRLTVAQAVLQNDEENMVFEERIDVFFERLNEPACRSEIILADERLKPPEVLLEYADPIELL